MSRTLTEVVDELDSGNPFSILYSAGVKGEKGSCVTCPLAVYIKQETGARWIEVTGDYVAVDYGTEEKHSVDLPPRLTEFMDQFDYGLYPGLDLHESYVKGALPA